MSIALLPNSPFTPPYACFPFFAQRTTFFYLLGSPLFGDRGANVHPHSSLVYDRLPTPCSLPSLPPPNGSQSSCYMFSETTSQNQLHNLIQFRCWSERSKQTELNQKENFLVSRISKLKNNQNRLSFGLFRFKPRKKINGFEDPLIKNVFWRFFALFQKNSVCFGPKHRNKPKQSKTNRKKCFLVSRNKPKNN
jgi:hypothetical protein